MSVSPKVPVVITDKNNRVTTVYRNPQKDTAQLRVPPPQPVKTETAEARAERAMKQLSIGDMYQQTAQPNLTFLAQHDPELLDSVVDRCLSDQKEMQLWLTNLCSFHKDSRSEDEAREQLAVFRWRYELQSTAIKVGRVISPGELGHFTTDNLLERVALMHGRDPDDWDLQHARVIGIGIEKGFRLSTPQHEQDVRFVKENREAVEGILPLLAERETINREVIEELLNHSVPVLREGML